MAFTATGGVTAVATTQVEQAPVVVTATNAAKAVAKLVAARLAADVMGTPTLVIARTDAEAADLVTEMGMVKHHFAAGVKAQEGIEF